MDKGQNEHIRTTIHALLDEDNVTLVFPTETVAQFWAADYAFGSEKGAIFLDRVMSWDNFRALFLSVRSQLPVNAIIRSLFAREFVDSPVGSRLTWFVRQTAGETNAVFAPTIAKLLGRLDAFNEMAQKEPELYRRLPHSLRKDIAIIRDAYSQFLAQRQLFEPSFEHVSISNYTSRRGLQRYVVCFPQMISFFSRFLQELGTPNWIETMFDNLSCNDVVIEKFPNELIELRVQLRRINQLLAEGTAADEIVITLADLEHSSEYLLHEATTMGVRLAVIGGRPPVQFSSGKFLLRLQSCVRHSFSIDSMKALLLDSGLPWRQLDLNRSLITRAIELNIVFGSVRRPIEDQWEMKLSTYSKDKDLLNYYRLIKDRLTALDKASTYQELSKALQSILNELLVKDQWPELEADVLAFCIDRLEDVKRAMSVCAIEHVNGLFGFYLTLLGQTPYVVQQHEPVIRVYPYGVSAGLQVAHHFVLGCTHDATSVASDLFGIFPETIKSITTDEKEDLSSALLAIYAASGANVHMSMGNISFANTVALIPVSVREFGNDVETLTESYPVDSIQLESLMWNTGTVPNIPASIHQTWWFEYASRTVFGTNRYDFAMQKAPAAVLSRIVDAQGLFQCSPTAVDVFKTCPMKWASMYLFGLRDVTLFDSQPLNAMDIGNLIHSVYERFFAWATSLGPFTMALHDRYHTEIMTIFEEEFTRFASDAAAPAKSTLRWLYREYSRLIPMVVDAELSLFDRSNGVDFEYAFDKAYYEKKYRLKGRIDKVLALESQQHAVAIVDYKKNYRGTVGSYMDVGNRNISFQLPMYAKILEEDDRNLEVRLAAYYDTATGTYKVIWNTNEKNSKQELLAELERQLDTMVRRLSEGDFIATPSKENCKNCQYRQICRRRYAFR